MVDRDKIRERMGDSNGDNSQSTKEGRGSKARKSKDRSGSKKAKSEVSSRNTSSGRKSSSSSVKKGNVSRKHIKKVLMAIANSILYAEGRVRELEDPENAREEYSELVANNMYEQYSDITSQYEVQRIAEKYGFDWSEDIVSEVLEEQDYLDMVGVER